jgi:hypothetical protein
MFLLAAPNAKIPHIFSRRTGKFLAYPASPVALGLEVDIRTRNRHLEWLQVCKVGA